MGFGDMNSDGFGDIIAGTATSGGRVKEFSGKDSKTVLANFNTFATGGIQVAAGNFSSPNHADLVVSGRGNFNGGDVRIYEGTTSTLYRNFQAAPGNTAGTNIAVGSFSGNLVNQVVTAGAPERESWRLAFGLMVTLIWLYLEILRLLAILNRR